MGKAITRYPDPAVEIIDPRFAQYKIGTLLWSGYGRDRAGQRDLVWFGDGGYLLWSDIPKQRILKWQEATGAVSVYRNPSNYTNGHTRDRQGRLISCEHGTRRVTRTEYDGTITVLIDNFDGKRFNAPNDAVVHPTDISGLPIRDTVSFPIMKDIKQNLNYLLPFIA